MAHYINKDSALKYDEVQSADLRMRNDHVNVERLMSLLPNPGYSPKKKKKSIPQPLIVSNLHTNQCSFNHNKSNIDINALQSHC